MLDCWPVAVYIASGLLAALGLTPSPELGHYLSQLSSMTHDNSAKICRLATASRSPLYHRPSGASASTGIINSPKAPNAFRRALRCGGNSCHLLGSSANYEVRIIRGVGGQQAKLVSSGNPQ